MNSFVLPIFHSSGAFSSNFFSPISFVNVFTENTTFFFQKVYTSARSPFQFVFHRIFSVAYFLFDTLLTFYDFFLSSCSFRQDAWNRSAFLCWFRIINSMNNDKFDRCRECDFYFLGVEIRIKKLRERERKIVQNKNAPNIRMRPIGRNGGFFFISVNGIFKLNGFPRCFLMVLIYSTQSNCKNIIMNWRVVKCILKCYRTYTRRHTRV